MPRRCCPVCARRRGWGRDGCDHLWLSLLCLAQVHVGHPPHPVLKGRGLTGVRYGGTVPLQDLAKGGEIGLTDAQQAAVAHALELAAADPVFDGALGDTQHSRHFAGLVETSERGRLGGHTCGMLFHTFSLAWTAPRLMF